MKQEQLMNVLTLAAVAAGLYLAYKGAKAAAGVASSIGAAAGAAGDTAAGGISAIGTIFGLPTIAQTIDNPAQVRWLIDNVGHGAASKWGTASAYVRALGMPAGSGNNSPPSNAVLSDLGIPTNTNLPGLQGQVSDFISGGRDYSGSILGSGPSFGQVANGSTSTNPLWWY